MDESKLIWGDARIIQDLIEDVRQAETELHRRNLALQRALSGLVDKGLKSGGRP